MKHPEIKPANGVKLAKVEDNSDGFRDLSSGKDKKSHRERVTKEGRAKKIEIGQGVKKKSTSEYSQIGGNSRKRKSSRSKSQELNSSGKG